MTDITKALIALRPDSLWVVREEKIIWNDTETSRPTDEEIQTKLSELRDAEPMRLLRQERDRRIAQTDWRATVDYPGTDQTAWLTYRQALRDLPSTASPTLDAEGNLTNVTWPTKPT